MTDLNHGTRHTDDHDMVHATHLEQTLQELQETVKEHEIALLQLRSSPSIHRQIDTPSKSASLEVMTVAYDDLASQTPYLPFPDSVLPALVALRRNQETVDQTKTFLTTQNESIEIIRQRLDVERINLKNQQALSHSLKLRIQSLKDGLESRMEMGPDDIARERIDELKQRKKHYDQETSKLLKSLRKFIDEHLATMLAAEELGGPVVGDMMDADADDLAAGFSSQGRLKKPSEKPSHDGKRQRRIDEIWGSQENVEDRTTSHSRDETTAAGQEMRDLTEGLLNSLAQSDGDSSAAYVQLPRESAAARFLVRSKVAQFHPKDSTRLRLVDFGKELDE
ncbi:hypothetical protein F5Y15DRAFT_279958 [Xylariaceae sp. FL0016]|nr:hypothetical protein F5Y15DRAFT_279958 [Xylariaceae sp. FL0016]